MKVLHNRSFSLLWTGQSISMFGLAIYITCLPFLVFRAGGSATELGLAHTFFIIPQLIFLLVSGVFVDRWPKKKILVISYFLRGLAVSGIAVLLLTDNLQLIHVYLLTGFLGLISTLYRPAVRGITPQIVDKTQLLSANSLRAISQQVSDMIGPVVGGFLVAAIGLYIAYTVNAITFLLSALFVSLIAIRSTKKKTEDTPTEKTTFWKDFTQGWSAIKKRPWLGASILIGSLSNIGIAAFDVIILPVYADNSFNGVQTYGIFLAAMAIGALICATLIGRLERISKRGILYYLFMALSGLFILGISFTPPLLVSLLLLAAIGFCLTAFIIIWDSATQELIEEEVLGRVVSFQMFGGLLLLPVGYSIFGFSLDKLGTTLSMSIAGVSIILVAALGLKNKKIRELDLWNYLLNVN
ncbi:MFS transporter [Chryseomicrobium sp. FSL W7-1435]